MLVSIFAFLVIALSSSTVWKASGAGIKQVTRDITVCPDLRRRLNVSQTMGEPFRSVVRITLSSGRCSGVLISQQHVLTSAHCVHDRTAFTSPLSALKVGIVQYSLKRRILASYFVEKVFVPSLYLSGAPKSAKDDYAVLKLRRQHGQSYLKMEAISDADLRKALHTVHFASFPLDKGRKQMWYTSCTYLRPKKDVIMSKCFAKRGSSGAGVYVYKRRMNKRVVVGVLSGVKQSNCTIVTTRLTASKIKIICSWIGSGRKCP